MHLEISCAADFNTVQANLDSVSDWISDQHMDLNAKKCKYMVISRKRVPYWLDSDLNLMDSSLERVCTYKYLGIRLNDTLSWSHHIEEIYKKATRQIGMIYRRFYLVCSSNTLLHLYLGYVRPLLEYATPVWDPHYTIHKEMLEKVQILCS